jgi:voltage-gated potassium channel
MIAVVLMVVGIGLVGAITASVATWMVSHVQQERSREQ